MKIRASIAALSLSAAGLIGIAVSEGYKGDAYTPLPGDRLTLGFGDAQDVKPGQKTTPVRALIRLGSQVSKQENDLKSCFGNVELYQHEWDSYVKLSVNVGSGAVCSSTIPAKLQSKKYYDACKTILDFDGFRDMAKPMVKNQRTGKMEYPLVKIKGLTIRRQGEFKECIGNA